MQTVMILGAGIYQTPLIQTAKRMGLRTIVSSIPGDYPGFSLADRVYYENTTDKEAILKIAKKENIDAILTSGTDVAVTSIGYVNDELSLNGVDWKTAQKTADKAVMKQALQAGGVRTAEFECVYTLVEAIEASERIGYPVILKCVDKSGSRGIVRADCKADVESAYNYAKAASNAPHILVEKYLKGKELGLDGYIDGDNILLVPHQKIVFYNGATDVPLGHAFPYYCDEMLRQDILTQARNAIYALGLQKCFFNMDIMVCGSEAYIIEVGARTGATCIPELMSIYCGWNFYEHMLKLALGESLPSPIIEGTPCMAQLLISERDGILCDWNESAAHCPGVVSLTVDYPRGAHVRRFHVGPDRLGHIIVKGQKPEQKLKTALEALALHIEPDIK